MIFLPISYLIFFGSEGKSNNEFLCFSNSEIVDNYIVEILVIYGPDIAEIFFYIRYGYEMIFDF